MTRFRRVGTSAALLAALVLAGVALVRFLGGEGSREAREVAFRRANDADLANSADSAPPPELTATRAEVTPPADIVEAAAAADDGDDPVAREATLQGRVEDANGRPVIGASIEVSSSPGRAFSVLDLEYAYQSDGLAQLRSDRAGRFSFRLARGRPVDLNVAADGFATQWVPNRYAGEHVVVVLDQGCTLHGRLIRADDGTPVEGAKLRVFRYGGPSIVSFKTTSDADGRYRFAGLPADSMVLETLPVRERSPGWMNLDFGADRSLVKDLALERGLVVKGRVTDAKSGLPIEGAEVGEGWTFRKLTRSDANGTYELSGFGGSGVPDVHVRARGYGRQLRTYPKSDGEVITLDFALTSARKVTGRVVDASHAPVSGVYIAAVASAFVEGGNHFAEWPSTRSAADGSFTIDGLTPEFRHTLFVQKHGFATLVYELPTTESTTPTVEVGEIALPQPALLLGRVVDDQGRGLADVPMTLSGCNRDRYRWIGDGEARPTSVGNYVESREARTDDAGRFSFADLPAGSFKVSAQPKRTKAPPGVAVEIAEGETKSGVIVTLSAGAGIAGRVVQNAAAGVGEVWVVVESASGGNTRVSTKTTADGRFEVRGLEDGLYRVSARFSGMGAADAREKLLPARVDAVKAGTLDLEITLTEGVPICGIVRDGAGQPVSHVWVIARIEGKDENWSDTTDRAGNFELLVPADAVVTLRVMSQSGGRLVEELGAVLAGVRAGSKDLQLTLVPLATPAVQRDR